MHDLHACTCESKRMTLDLVLHAVYHLFRLAVFVCLLAGFEIRSLSGLGLAKQTRLVS